MALLFFRLWRKHNSYESTAFICQIGILVLLGGLEYCLFYRKDQEFFFFLAAACDRQLHLSSPSMDGISAPTVEAQSPSHQSTRDFPSKITFG